MKDYISMDYYENMGDADKPEIMTKMFIQEGPISFTKYIKIMKLTINNDDFNYVKPGVTVLKHPFMPVLEVNIDNSEMTKLFMVDLVKNEKCTIYLNNQAYKVTKVDYVFATLVSDGLPEQKGGCYIKITYQV